MAFSKPARTRGIPASYTTDELSKVKVKMYPALGRLLLETLTSVTEVVALTEGMWYSMPRTYRVHRDV